MIKIIVNGIKTIVPWDGTTPDLSGLPQSAHSALLSAFAEGHYSVLPAIPSTPQSDWESFNIAIFSNTEWQTWQIPQDLRTAIIGAAIARLPDQLQTAYGNAKLVVPPSAPAIAAWNTIAQEFHIPLEF